MKLKNQVEWALCCCCVMASLRDGQYVSTTTLATSLSLPRDYLAKALQRLSRENIIESNTGSSGGYRLAKASNEVTILQVIEAVQGTFMTFEATDASSILTETGLIKSGRSLASAMRDADRAWRATLSKFTLSDLALDEGLEELNMIKRPQTVL